MELQNKQIYINVSDSKNVVTGNIISGGGPVHVGDKIIQEAPKELPKALTSVPTRNPENLIGRKTFLKELRANLNSNKEVVLVNAMGGVGKTSIAEAYTAAHYNDYACMLWIQQGEGEDIRFSFTNNQDLLSNLEIDAHGKRIEELFREICNKLRNIRAQPKLLVIDNINQQVQEYWQQLPKPPNWHVLYTSREKLEDVKEMELDFLTIEDALALYTFYYGKEIDNTEIAQIIELFDRHTLTIEILAKAQKKNRYEPAELKAALQENITAGIKTKHSLKKVDKVKNYLVNIFKMSKLAEQEIWLLKQFACLPSTFHRFGLLERLLATEDFPKKKLSGNCNELHEKGWLLYNETEDSYKLHAIIQEVLVDQYPIEQEDVNTLLDKISKILHMDNSKDNSMEKVQFIPYGEVLLTFLTEESQAKNYLRTNLGLLSQALGNAIKAKSYFEEALFSTQQNFKNDGKNLNRLYASLGGVLYELGDFTRAKEYFKLSLSFYLQYYGEFHPNIAISYSNLANVLVELKDFVGAKMYSKKALFLDIKNFGESHPRTILSYMMLAGVLYSHGEYKDAKTFFEKTTSYYLQNFGENHPNTARSYSGLSSVHQALGDYNAAKECLTKAMVSDRENYGENHPNTAIRYFNLGMLNFYLNQLPEALELMEKAYSIFQQNLPKGHPNIKLSKNWIDNIKKKI